MDAKPRKIVFYTLPNGRVPFTEWFESFKDGINIVFFIGKLRQQHTINISRGSGPAPSNIGEAADKGKPPFVVLKKILNFKGGR